MRRLAVQAGVIALLVHLGGCASLEGDDYAVYDQAPGFNRASYEFTDSIDRAVLTPVARGYRTITPDWLELGISNMFLNLTTISSATSGLLQGKPKSSGIDMARILINSTIGLAGFFDVARAWGLRYQQEDLGQTLAVWGVKKTRYVFVPGMGPSTVRDLPSDLILSYLPRWILGYDYHWGVSALNVVRARAGALGVTDTRDEVAMDPYVFTRDAYYQRRKFLIYDGQPPLDDEFDDFGDEEDF